MHSTNNTTIATTTTMFHNNSDYGAILNTTTTNVPPNPELVQILRVLDYVNYVFLPTFLILGLTGNTLTFFIMRTNRYARLTSRYILMALATSDSILLLTQPLNKMFIQKLIGSDWRAFSDFGCKLFFVVFKTSKMTSSWFVVFLCFERFVAVWFPLRAKMICTKRNTLIGICVVYAFITTYTSVWSYASQIINGVCYPDVYNVNDPRERLTFGALLMTALTIYSILPTTIMLILTPLIIYKLMSRSKIHRQISATRSNSSGPEERITAMLLGVVFAYIILIIPVTSLHFVSFVFGVKAFGNNSTGFLIFRDVTQILEQLNYAVNFFLYVMTSQQFRSGIIGLFCSLKPKKALSCQTSDSTISKSVRKKYLASDVTESDATTETSDGSKRY